MCRILQIETATDVCSVSVAENGKVFAMKETQEGRSHAVVLATFINELLLEYKLTMKILDAVAVSKGPGSYTGLRIGVSVAKGICYATGLPLIGVPTLESMSHGLSAQLKDAGENYLLAPMIDARRMEVYTALFNSALEVVRETHALVIERDSFESFLIDYAIYFFGSGADKLTNIIQHENARFITDFMISSSHMGELAYQLYLKQKFEDIAYFEPFYLKDFITTIPKKKL
jgi:tRNA threonylcarbamoyladenosine biosynthesis protein TsaB